jgi:hypothetical protein
MNIRSLQGRDHRNLLEPVDNGLADPSLPFICNSLSEFSPRVQKFGIAARNTLKIITNLV